MPLVSGQAAFLCIFYSEKSSEAANLSFEWLLYFLE